MLQVWQDEYQLFRDYFTIGEEFIINYLQEDISFPLSNQLHVRILNETNLDVLAELCTLLLFNLKSMFTESSIVYQEVNNQSMKFLVDSILSDAQDRLSFMAQEYIQSQIRSFTSNEKEILVFSRDVGMPQPIVVSSAMDGVAEVLKNTTPRRSSVNISPTVQKTINQDPMSAPPEFVLGGGEWYPSLQKTISILSKLHSSLPV